MLQGKIVMSAHFALQCGNIIYSKKRKWKIKYEKKLIPGGYEPFEYNTSDNSIK